jgi:hypothetical protein
MTSAIGQVAMLGRDAIGFNADIAMLSGTTTIVTIFGELP